VAKGVTTRGLPGRGECENESSLSALDLEVAHRSWSSATGLQAKREVVYLLQTERIIVTLLATLSASQVVLYKEGAV
jgi:hypothetical protein